MKIRSILLSISGFLLLGVLSAHAQNRAGNSSVTLSVVSPGQQISPDEIIRRFTQRESELRERWKEYIYRQETKLQVLGPADTVSGEFYQLSEFVLNDAGTRMERIIKAPQPTLDRAGLVMTSEDRNALINLQPFALTAEELPKYNLKYIGKEKVDELNTYVFEVTPKVLSDPRELDRARKQKVEGNFFQGRVWVDDQDFQIVKTAGKTVPEFKQRFPKFETYRENIDGRYWFPTYTYGDDELVFDKGFGVHVRLVVRYKDYRRFQGDVRILDNNADDPDASKGTGKPAKPAEKEPEKKTKPPQS
ncbi:MAG TPA: hypothetical protein VFD58_08420 [Blastocatellia bacterium]|nr:hypothetical protein [Blastocatellia bacterium]